MRRMEPCLPVLPTEIRLQIYSLCTRDDLKELSLCNKKFHSEVLPILWEKMEIQWESLEKNSSLLRNSNKYKPLVSSIRFCGKVDQKVQGYVTFRLGLFLMDFDPSKIKTLEFDDYIIPEGLRIVHDFFPNLKSLEFGRVKADWDFLSQFRGLRSLSLICLCKVRKSHWKQICQMDHLQTLELIANWDITEDEIGEVDFNLTNLVRLNLSSAPISNDLLSLISAKCRNLKSLDLSFSRVTDVGLACISHLRTLRRLSLKECKGITDNGIFFISSLPLLQYLNIYYSSATFECLQHVSKLKTLTSLNIKILNQDTDENFAPIGELVLLRKLKIYGADNLTDASLEVISKLVYLEKLEIDECDRFTDKGLVHLTKLPRLRVLSCDGGNKITDEGLESHGLSDLLI